MSVCLGSQSATDEPRQAVLWVWHKPAGGEMKNVKGGETQDLLTPPTGCSLQQKGHTSVNREALPARLTQVTS